MAGSTSTPAATSCSISSVTAPGRSNTGVWPDTSTIVDSSPIPTGPPSNIISIRPFRSCHTCCAVVGLGLPDRFALGAATGTPAKAISLLASSRSGIRTATVSNPPVVPYGTRLLFIKTNVSGPGQNLSAKRLPTGIIPAVSGSNSSIQEICAIRGLSDGLPLAA